MAYRAPLTNHHADGTLPGEPQAHQLRQAAPHRLPRPRVHPRHLLLRLEEGGVRQGLRQRVPQAAPRQPRRGAERPLGSLTPHPVPLSEVLLPHYLTVGHLLRQLQDLDPGLPIRLAINPDFPFTHYLGAEIVVRDGKAFIADDGQEDYLPPSVSDALAWA